MATTPPPIPLRARTPPSPQHADSYEPYSPRRSKRSTAHSNPYSSFNGERSPKTHLQRTTPPPTSVKKARFARAPTQLSSPPSSPASPIKKLHKTPRKQVFNSRKSGSAQSDSDNQSQAHSLAPPVIDPVTMLPTPSKTPKKRPAVTTSTARILSFQPYYPNDVMPSPRKIKKASHSRSLNAMPGFELYEDDVVDSRGDQIEIYTDANARVPEMDESEDNPFVGRKKPAPPHPQQRRRGGRKKSREEVEHEERIEEAVRRDEGVTYVFRGKKIFRRFQEPDRDGEEEDNASTGLSGTSEQRRLKRQAGAAAQRPLTRSAIKPRLLFPSEEQQRERERGTDDVDEEAVTDIEMGNVEITANGTTEDLTTPVKDRFIHKPATPPSTTRATRMKKAPTSAPEESMTPIPEAEDEPEPMSVGTDESFASNMGGRGKGRSPFDSWTRTKCGRKRAGEAVEEGASAGKRTRSTVLESPA